MSEIKIIKSGIDSYEASVAMVSNYWVEIENIEKNLKTALASGEWQGKSCERCIELLELSSLYRKSIMDIFDKLNTHEKELVQNVDQFTVSAIKSL